MKRITTWVAVATLLVTGAASAGTMQYGWSLSGSNTDAGVNTGPASMSAPFPVYLWLVCSTFNAPGAGFGMSAAEFDVASNFFFAGFTPLSGALNAGTDSALLLAVGACPAAGTILGSWNFIDFSGLGGTVCLVPSAANEVNGTVDCDVVSPLVHDNAVTGFTTDGSDPCAVSVCTPDAVSSSTWGALKSLYR